jgi:hypothetical protein
MEETWIREFELLQRNPRILRPKLTVSQTEGWNYKYY